MYAIGQQPKLKLRISRMILKMHGNDMLRLLCPELQKGLEASIIIQF